MHPEICTIGPFTIYSYGLMLAVAFVISSTLAVSQAKRQHIQGDIIFNLSFVAFISGIAGSRFLYVIENIPYYFKNPLEIIMLQHGGLSWFGGLIFAVISSGIYLKNKRLSVYKIFDLLVPFVALGQAIGRIGCLLNGCCFGKISKFGLYFALHKSILIPTQLYSSLSLVLIFIILRWLQEKPHKEGEIILSYLLLYSIKRFSIEFWRADNPVVFWDLTLFQIFSIVIFCFSLVKLILIRSR
jgi:phosphatidylglycerol:prolipoprotein diacylglycerol transferase